MDRILRLPTRVVGKGEVEIIVSRSSEFLSVTLPRENAVCACRALRTSYPSLTPFCSARVEVLPCYGEEDRHRGTFGSGRPPRWGDLGDPARLRPRSPRSAGRAGRGRCWSA